MTETPSAMRKHSVLIAGHQTSVTLEDAFWAALKAMTKADGVSLNTLITDIDTARVKEDTTGNLSSAIRVYILERLQTSD